MIFFKRKMYENNSIYKVENLCIEGKNKRFLYTVNSPHKFYDFYLFFDSGKDVSRYKLKDTSSMTRTLWEF